MIDSSVIRAHLPLALGETHLPLPGRVAGKVRDSYPLGNDRRLLITTDRLSAFDRILAQVPFKGQALNELARWWFAETVDIVANHVIAVPDPNALIAREAVPFPVEVVVRGYITGVTSTALWRRYELGEREIYGYHFREGLYKNEALPEPIITPTTKGGATGHDERITRADVVKHGLVDAATWEAIQVAALALFRRGQAVARRAGLILVDTKYEFGRGTDGRLLLIDEVHTPDSSRFWLAASYPERFAHSEEPENFDKEFVRLAYARYDYRGDGEPPVMPDELWVEASIRYITIYEMLTGRPFRLGAYPVEPRLTDNLRRAGVIA
ncbi:MAG: phosphoribosylaminoimidazolesuccinocarboxamide synthase [Chloroflexi bacterium]|nr:phosphoribosylaminoimidazolesuccinocarboxamide synthase [Chloroflexota bacterium]